MPINDVVVASKVDARLKLMDSYLMDFNAMNPNSEVAVEPMRDLSTSGRVHQKFPSTGEGGDVSNNENMLQVTWLLNEKPFTPKEQLTLSILDHLLMVSTHYDSQHTLYTLKYSPFTFLSVFLHFVYKGTSSSTLRKALTDSGIGSEVIGGGLSDELSQATYSVGLKGIKLEDMEKVESLVEETLAKFAEHGPDQSAVEASINSIEFMLREFNTGSYPKGLSVMLTSLSQWLYDRDPLQSLRFEEPLQQLKRELKEGKPVFSNLVKKLLLENKHKTSIVMESDSEIAKEEELDEVRRLAEIKSKMTEGEIEQVKRSP